jgi:uncharacterized protein YjbI with pentapeptide repeats
MSEPLFSAFALDTENLAADAFCLDFASDGSRLAQAAKLDLCLDIKFGEQWQSLLQGRVQFALKGGQLQLNLDPGIFHIQGNAFLPYGFLIIEAASHPVWRFTAPPKASHLDTTFKAVSLGQISPIADAFQLAIAFVVNAADITLTQTENLWRHDIHPNQYTILERVIARLLQQTVLYPCVSWLNLRSPQLSLSETPFSSETGRAIAVDILEESLQTLIDRIYHHPSHDLLNLAELAELNPLEDLAGGNFIATDLSGITLAGADLYQTNFRGSNLTDADLSEANLSHARLSGADLSGAYLGNANLRSADFQRASLALSNLIGADLRGANLEGANLSQTNFSGAMVTETRFGDNPGLTPELQDFLRAQGGIFAN